MGEGFLWLGLVFIPSLPQPPPPPLLVAKWQQQNKAGRGSKEKGRRRKQGGGETLKNQKPLKKTKSFLHKCSFCQKKGHFYLGKKSIEQKLPAGSVT